MSAGFASGSPPGSGDQYAGVDLCLALVDQAFRPTGTTLSHQRRYRNGSFGSNLDHPDNHGNLAI
jgi:hypothetical protein